MTDEQDAPDPDLGTLLHDAFRGLRQSWAAQLAPWDVTPFQWRALRTALENDGAVGLRPGELAERLRIAARSATDVVDQLESKGFVTRSPDPRDRRAVIVAATPAGRELHDAILAERRIRSEEFFGPLSPSERDDLAALLHKLAPRPTT